MDILSKTWHDKKKLKIKKIKLKHTQVFRKKENILGN